MIYEFKTHIIFVFNYSNLAQLDYYYLEMNLKKGISINYSESFFTKKYLQPHQHQSSESAHKQSIEHHYNKNTFVVIN
jgi:hypothetical protein